MGIGRTAVIVSSQSKLKVDHTDSVFSKDEVEEGKEDESNGLLLLTGGTIFLSELEVSAQRNGSQLFQKLARELRPLSKSLAELLHHEEKIIDLLCAYLLTPRGFVIGSASPVRGPSEEFNAYKKRMSDKAPHGYIVNVATNDVLHLLGVLAREIRHEIYPFLHGRILPRIIDDMLNSPTTTLGHGSNSKEADENQTVPLDVNHIESAFRTLSYFFKYNADQLVYNNSIGNASRNEGGRQVLGDADILRKYYGKTICHKRDIIRRLACESFAPLLRKCLDKGLKRHLSRTIKALASSIADMNLLEEDHVSRKESIQVVGKCVEIPLQTTNTMRKARDDAIDGVSSLLFEIARSAPGRVHSKKGRLVARAVVDCMTSFCSSSRSEEANDDDKEGIKTLGLEKSKADVVYGVASQFLYKLRGHVVRGTREEVIVVTSSFIDVLDEIHRSLTSATSIFAESPSSRLVEHVLGNIIDLVSETISFQNGRLVHDGKIHRGDGEADRITASLQTLLGDSVFPKAGVKLQNQILNYMCSAWKANPSHLSFTSRLEKFFPSIVSPNSKGTSSHTGSTSGLNPALVLARNLLPHLPKKVASSTLIPALLSAAASSVQNIEDSDASVVLLHTIATTTWPTDDSGNDEEIDIDDSDVNALFSSEAAEFCPVIHPNIRRTLFEICLSNSMKIFSSNRNKSTPSSCEEALFRIGYASRCIPFLVCIECSNIDADSEDDDSGTETSKYTEDQLIRVFKWYGSILKNLDAVLTSRTETIDKNQDIYVTQSLLLESFSKSAIECHNRTFSSTILSSLKKALAKATSAASSLAFLHPKSLWAMRGAAAIVKALDIIDPGVKINDKSNEMFHTLASNLAESNHFMRMYTLEILDSFPKRPFVTDHADIDLADDLEEEPSYRPKPTGKGSKSTGDSNNLSFSGSCDIISLLKGVESTPVTLANERKLTTQLSRVEVYARTGKLPIAYAESTTLHMLGLLHVKFAPVWPAAVRVIVALSHAQEGPVWPCIEVALTKSMQRPLHNIATPKDSTGIIDISSKKAAENTIIYDHHVRCFSWEASRGKNHVIFTSSDKERNGQVSRHVEADDLTRFESVWSIMENAPHLTSTKSKVVVPMFFNFMLSQYYIFHSDDPDSRELNLVEILGEFRCEEWPREELGRKALQKKLEIFLKTFAAVKGPQQLFKHRTLLQMFVSFLSNPDSKLANLALSCVLRYKLPYLTPYAEHVQPMLQKEGLREALTKFDLSEESELVDISHRLDLIPIVTRILFGRFLSRGNGAKSSKDPPAARRAAILSFFSGLGERNGEINYFIYMMVRAFIPLEMNMVIHGPTMPREHLEKMIESSGCISSNALLKVPIKRQEGFLNLLYDVIVQIGYGIKHFVPNIMNLLLALCEQTEDAFIVNKNQSVENKDLYGDESTAVDRDDYSRIGRVRSLCFLRLSQMLSKFSFSIDFIKFGKRLWNSMTSSVIALPNTVVNAENPPSLLQLIETVASQRELIPLLQESDNAVIAMFKCIEGTTRSKVIGCIMRAIDGLLTDGGSFVDGDSVTVKAHSLGQKLILKHIHLLISQFTKRLTSDSKAANLDDDVATPNGADKVHKRNPTDGLQLNILCRVSELLVSASEVEDENIETMERLCSLLVPSLKFDSHPNHLYVMRTVSSLIPKISDNAAISHYYSLSKLLGPNKAASGMTSNEARTIISSAITGIGSRGIGSNLNRVATAVVELNAASTAYVNEHDFDRMLPVLNGLGASNDSEGSWFDLSKARSGSECKDSMSSIAGPRVLLPLMFTCFHLLYDSDGVISRASSKALKAIVSTCLDQIQSSKEEQENSSHNAWLKFIESTFMPCLKVGIMAKNLPARRSFVLLVSHVSKLFKGFQSVHLYGDLECLIREDDPDQDFFLNVTHVQLHRRARAFTKLRKLILSDGKESNFSDQSCGNILLPLAMHPVYEIKSKSEEAYVVEAIATIGEIAKKLPWGKYNGTLQTLLNNLTRYPDQERFLIATMCAIIDAFHFDVDTGNSSDDSGTAATDEESTKGNGVWRSLNNRIIPKVETFLVKEKIDKHGSKSKCLRSSVALALMKLFQKLPIATFEAKLPKLVTVVCNGMQNKDSDERDTARDTISKMAVSIDLKYLPLILSSLSVSLCEGYKLHVRSAALHSILVSISKSYASPVIHADKEAMSLPFDRCVPAMLDLIHQDVFGEASVIKEVQNVEKRLVKEAMGSKSLDSLEIIARSILFKPSLVSIPATEPYPGFSHASPVHALVTPLLKRLRDPDVAPSTIGKVKDCLNRIALGFSHNTSATYKEVLPFVFGTVSPFVYGNSSSLSKDGDDDLENSDDEMETPIIVSKSKSKNRADAKSSQGKKIAKTVAVSTWIPSVLGTAADQKSAFDMKKKQKTELHKVSDGVAAPKLTGSSRHSPMTPSTSRTLNNPSNSCAVNFGLVLLYSCLKRLKFDSSDEMMCSMVDPYLPLLTHCVRYSNDNQALVLALKCLGVLLRMDLPSVIKTAKQLGPSILDHLTTSNAAASTQSDIVQGCFKSLTLLITHHKFAAASSNRKPSSEASGENKISEKFQHDGAHPLSEEQMQALLNFLHSAVIESDHHNATFGLVKAISSKRFMSAEFYDLMDIILKLSVQSQKSAIRLLSSQIFLQYLMDYPMGKQRIDRHLQQIVLNIKYEYEEGRLSAIDLLTSVIQKFPFPVLESNSQLFFLPLVLQMVNDDCKSCKEAVANCISVLIKRLSTDTVQNLFDYVKRWSQSSGIDSIPMQKAAAQLFGIFVVTRPDYIKRGSNLADLMALTVKAINKYVPFDDNSEWELLYFNLVCVEKVNKEFPSLVGGNYDLWGAQIKLLAFPHPWVMQISSRIINSHLASLDPEKLLHQNRDSFVVKIPGSLYDMSRNLCRQLDFDDIHYVETIATLAIKNIVCLFQAMKHHPDLCYTTDQNGPDREEIGDNDNFEKISKDPCRWIMARLSNMAKPKGNRRRESIFKCFAALCASCAAHYLTPYLELIIDPIDRAIREASNSLRPEEVESSPFVALSKEVLQLYEDAVGTDCFVESYAKVNRKVREKRDKRRQEIAAEAVHDPQAAAKRKIKKQLLEKERKKRRVEDRRSMRGGAKKKHY